MSKRPYHTYKKTQRWRIKKFIREDTSDLNSIYESEDECERESLIKPGILIFRIWIKLITV